MSVPCISQQDLVPPTIALYATGHRIAPGHRIVKRQHGDGYSRRVGRTGHRIQVCRLIPGKGSPTPDTSAAW
eukprot:3671917-Rhodomonas_salina.2